MATTFTKRPRNVGPIQAASMLYGDWGTSKAYVIGLAFALAGYSSFWLIAAISVLAIFVGLSYITICKFNPHGGGVYASARQHSEVLSLLGAFFLIADYLITASLSAVSSFEYLGVAYPPLWAMSTILLVGLINFFGPRHSGNLAFFVALPTILSVIVLSILASPYLLEAVTNLEPLRGGIALNWSHFVSVIVGLSGIEAMANATGVMRLDRGSSEDHPSVHQTSKKAITWVMLEVSFFTAFLGLMVNAIPGLQIVDGNVNAPDQPEIRDYMLKYMGNFFGSLSLDPAWGYLFGSIVGLVFAILLLSAVNTAITALVSLMFVMSRDGEMPSRFQKINKFGVPIYPLILATLGPIVVLVFVHDVASLANLYAVGFVGAMALNLGTNGFNKEIPMANWSRHLMRFTCLIMIAIEITLFIEKPDARRFAISILAFGLILRALVVEHRQKQWEAKKVQLRHASLFSEDTRVPLHQGALLCAVVTIGKTLDFALQEAKNSNQPLYILFVREQKIITEQDRSRTWLDDDEACRIFDYAKDSAHEVTLKFFYAISDSPATTILEMARKLQISRLILGRSRRGAVLKLLRGNVIEQVSERLNPDVDLIVIS